MARAYRNALRSNRPMALDAALPPRMFTAMRRPSYCDHQSSFPLSRTAYQHGSYANDGRSGKARNLLDSNDLSDRREALRFQGLLYNRRGRTGRAFARFLCTVSPTRASRTEEPGNTTASSEYRDATMAANRSAPRAIQE
jgi:hypothetical protein